MTGRLHARVALFAVLAHCSSLASAATCYVDTAATGSNNGTSWSNAYTDLQSALGNYLNCSQIWVARGTYKPTATTDRTISFNIKPGVIIYGGFAGTEAALADRLLAANPTILSGDIGVAGDSSDNSYHVVVLDGTTASGSILPTTLLAYLTISDGNANGAGANEGSGGGLYCNGQGAGHACNPHLARIIFENNSAGSGGAIYNDGHGGGASSPSVQDTVMRNNQAANLGGGGAMYNNGNGGASNPDVDRVTFIGNNGALAGGAMFNDGTAGISSPTVSNSTFYENTAALGGAILNYGASAGHANPVLRYDTFYRNKATGGPGGAIYNSATGGDAAPNMSGMIFWADEAVGAPVENYSIPAAALSLEYSITPECPPAAVGCINTDPMLGPLRDNGGSAPTMRPEIGSPAIDNGNAVKCPADDERGITRPQGSQCDIGAVELKLSERKICYVNAAAGATNNGLAWATAYVSLQSALADATCGEVWVAKGTYKTTSSADRTVSFVLPPGKAVYGGFAGAETLRGQRNATVNPTVLSGEIAAPAFKDDNSYHVVVADAVAAAADITNATVLDGFTITGGYADDDIAANIGSAGGGLVCNAQNGHVCSPTLANLVFSANYALTGGALGLIAEHGVSSPSLTSVTFTGNNANEGGALYVGAFEGVANPNLTAVGFVGNSAGAGGAIFTSDGGVGSLIVAGATFDSNSADVGGGVFLNFGGSFTDVVFTGNHVTTSGGAVYNSGGGGQTFTRVTFVDNQAADHGGAVYNAPFSSTEPRYNAVTFIGNSANYGGAMANAASSPSITDALFLRNNGAFFGGAISNEGIFPSESSPIIDRAAFIDNTADLGGAVSTVATQQETHPVIRNATFTGNSSGAGAAYIDARSGLSASTEFRNVTFAFNPSVNGGDAVFLESSGGGLASATVSNSILYTGTLASNGQVYLGPETTISIDHSLVTLGCPVGATCTAVSSADPLLGLLEYYGGFTPTLMPGANSPALNIAVNCPPTDQRGVSRPQGPGCDIGAVERRAVEDYLFNNGFEF